MKHVELENVTDGWTKTLPSVTVQGSFQRNNNTEPDIDTGLVSDVTETSFNNPTYTIQNGLLVTGATNEITYSDWLDIFVNRGKELYLIITYNDNETVPSTQPSYPDKIPVTLQSFNPVWSMNNSEKALPSYTATFVETKQE